MLAALITTVSGVVSIDDVWGDEWDIILISLQVYISICLRFSIGLFGRCLCVNKVIKLLSSCVVIQSTGPFLHIGALAAVTALGWLVAEHVVRAERTSKCCVGF